MIEAQGKYSKAKIMIDEIEPQCLTQIYGFLNNSAFTNPIAIMPDCHAGKGSVIGFSMKMTKKIIPNVIGVDIGCNMLMSIFKENIFKNITKEDLNNKIRRDIPFGKRVHNRSIYDIKKFNWKIVNEKARKFAIAYNKEFDENILGMIPDYSPEWFKNKCSQIDMDYNRAVSSIGTLGGGNHFLCRRN